MDENQLTDKEQKLADLLFELGAIKFGAFKLKLHEKQPDAPLSPIYLNLRTKDHPKNPGPLTQEAMDLVRDLFAQMGFVPGERFADIPDAGQPFGDAWEQATRNRQKAPTRLTLHKQLNDNGTRVILPQVDGEFQRGDLCIVIDDLITQADSKLEAIRALESNGLSVKNVVILVDRQQGGREQLASAGYTLHPVFTLEELLQHYVSRTFITQETADEVTAYIASNRITA